MELASGDLVAARYRLERRIGEGGMGGVWGAEDAVAHGRVALKLLKDVAGDPDAPKRVVRGGRAAAPVRHPSLGPTRDAIDLGDGSPVLVMELPDGESLRERLRREPRIAVRELAAIMVQVVSAVGAAHALGIVHRDLKPENIFLCHGPTAVPVVKILDFGIAKLTALDGEARRSTGLTTGAVLGTPEYMAPEQVFAEADLDHRADIWALGLIIYQCLSGVLPTQAGSVGQVLKNVLARPFEPVERIVDGVPSELAQLVARMLSRERAARPGALREVLAIPEPIAAIEAPRFAAPAAAVRGSAVTLLPGAMPRQRWLSRSAARGIVAAVAVLVLGGAGWRWLRSDAPVVPDSPLAGPSARLALPVLDASGGGR